MGEELGKCAVKTSQEKRGFKKQALEEVECCKEGRGLKKLLG